MVAALILFLGATAAIEMPTDIFPEIKIPVVSVVWQYTGLNTTEMEQRFTTYSQYAISTSGNGIKGLSPVHPSDIMRRRFGRQPTLPAVLAKVSILKLTIREHQGIMKGIKYPSAPVTCGVNVIFAMIVFSYDTADISAGAATALAGCSLVS